MAKRKEPEPKAGCPEWLATYGDMVTLVLTFFVLLYSMSSIDINKFNALAASFSNQISISQSSGSSMNELLGSGLLEMPQIRTEPDADSPEYEDSQNELRKMASDLTTYFQQNNLTNQVSAELGNQEIIIDLKENVLFDSGSAILKDVAFPILDILADELLQYPTNDIEVIGHTDTDPIHTLVYPSNLYLSCARAVSVTTYFIDQKHMEPLRILPYGRGELVPKAPNDSAENKAKNRRVEIRIKSKFYSGGAGQ